MRRAGPSGANPSARQQIVLSPVAMNSYPSAVASRSPASWPNCAPVGCGMSMIGTSDAGSSRLSAVIVKRDTRAVHDVAVVRQRSVQVDMAGLREIRARAPCRSGQFPPPRAVATDPATVVRLRLRIPDLHAAVALDVEQPTVRSDARSASAASAHRCRAEPSGTAHSSGSGGTCADAVPGTTSNASSMLAIKLTPRKHKRHVCLIENPLPA